MFSAILILGFLLTLATTVPVAIQIGRGHPRGLFTVFFVELWERFSFYGMRSLLIFYLTEHFLFDDGLASRTFGSFTTLAYLLPLLGGVVADRYIGARRAVSFGAILLVAGHALMALEGPPATQVLGIGGHQYEVRQEGRGDARRLLVRDGAVSYPLQVGAGGELTVEGVGADSALPSHVAAGGYTLAVRDGDSLYTRLLFLALSCIALGVGFLKGNSSTLVGLLYGKDDPRQDAGFTLYYFGINIGSLWAALLCGYLAVRYDWAWGFGLAAVGMLAGLIAFQLGARTLQGLGDPPAGAALKRRVWGPATREMLVYAVSLFALVPVFVLMQRSERVGWALLVASLATLGYVVYRIARLPTRVERERMYLALLLVAGSIVFWTLFLQAGTSLNLFADRHTNLTLVGQPHVFHLFGREVLLGTEAMRDAAPAGVERLWIDAGVTAAQVQSFNVAFVMLFAPLFAALWSRLRKRGLDPGPTAKFGLGLLQVGAGFLLIDASAGLADGAFRLPLLVLGLTYLLHTTGELCVSPIGLSELTKLSPPFLVSTMMAIWLLASSAAQFVSALIASLASAPTVAGQSLDAGASLARSLSVFGTVGWSGVAAGVVFLLLGPLVGRWAHRQA